MWVGEKIRRIVSVQMAFKIMWPDDIIWGNDDRDRKGEGQGLSPRASQCQEIREMKREQKKRLVGQKKNQDDTQAESQMQKVF